MKLEHILNIKRTNSEYLKLIYILEVLNLTEVEPFIFKIKKSLDVLLENLEENIKIDNSLQKKAGYKIIKEELSYFNKNNYNFRNYFSTTKISILEDIKGYKIQLYAYSVHYLPLLKEISNKNIIKISINEKNFYDFKDVEVILEENKSYEIYFLKDYEKYELLDKIEERKVWNLES
jgi:hypothetical protein